MQGVRLTTKEIDVCRKVFNRYDKNKDGTIDVVEIKSALEAIGQSTSDEDFFLLMSEADANNSGVIEFEEFLKAIEKQKKAAEKSRDIHATLDAFVALGGNANRTGKISLDRLRDTLQAFDLMPNIQLHDKDGSGFIEFDEFRALFD